MNSSVANSLLRLAKITACKLLLQVLAVLRHLALFHEFEKKGVIVCVLLGYRIKYDLPMWP